MSIFVCENCNHIDNTAMTRYWLRHVEKDLYGRALCSQCDPVLKGWHGVFPRQEFDPSNHKTINR